MSKLQNRVAIATGAAQGLGAVYAKALAKEGARVVVSDVLDPEPVVAQSSVAIRSVSIAWLPALR